MKSFSENNKNEVVSIVAKEIQGLSGTYKVGIGGDYPTITAAAAAFNNAQISGPVTFVLIDANYPSETFPITLNENSGSSVVNTLIIKPKTGITVNITASSTVILKVNGLDYFTLDGSNNGPILEI